MPKAEPFWKPLRKTLIGRRFFEAGERDGIHIEWRAVSPQVADLFRRAGQRPGHSPASTPVSLPQVSANVQLCAFGCVFCDDLSLLLRLRDSP
jgi:hypothetical protein